MEPSEQNCNETSKGDKENCSESFINGANEDTMKKRNVPVSSLSDDEATGTIKRAKTETDSTEERVFMSSTSTSNSNDNDILAETHTYGLPTIKIQPILGGKPLTFPVHPRLTILDLKDFILFALNIPHPQQILSFYCEEERKAVLLSNYSENTLLCTVPGLIDEITGRCAVVSLSFKMSSGMDFSINPSDVEYENTTSTDDTGYFEVNSSNSDSPSDSKISSLASTLASIIPFPPGTSKSSRMLLRSLSKSSPTNSNLPTLWEIYFPESGVKMMVTALINVNEVKSDEERESGSERSSDTLKDDDVKEKKESVDSKGTVKPASVPELVITPPDNTSEHLEPVVPVPALPSPLTPLTPSNSNSDAPKTHCEKCHLRCRPALRFICKCTKTFCQSHRYPDQHDCTYDHRADGMASIQANNPKIVKDKVGNF